MKKKRTPRQRALHAAQAVTIGLALAGCSLSHEHMADSGVATRPTVDAGEVVSDAGALPQPDAGHDSGTPATDVDAGVVADAGADWPCEHLRGHNPAAWSACCEETGWDWERGCGVWGPYVPPGEFMPASRSITTEAIVRGIA